VSQIIINSKGASLSKTNGLFEVRLRDNTKQSFHPNKVKSFWLSSGISVSTDAMLLALEHDIAVIITDNFGNPQGSLWNNQFGSIATIRKKQYIFCDSKEGKLWIKKTILQKIHHQLNFLYQIRYSSVPDEKAIPEIDNSITQIQKITESLQFFDPQYIEAWKDIVRGWEGTVSRYYFQALSVSMTPIFRFEGRSRPARDMFNCLLNYGYGVLYGKVESALIGAGIDPALGILHADEYNKPVFTYDFIEPYRIWIDTIIFRLCFSQQINYTCFDRKENSLWLNNIGKRVVIANLTTYWEEVINHNNRQRSRNRHLQLDAHELAQQLLNYSA
jgi:CRISPR-associated protein Cas1